MIEVDRSLRVEVVQMVRRVTKEEARAYVKRWQLVNEAEREELRLTTPEQKLRQLAALMASVDQLGWSEALAAEDDEVRELWKRLRRAHGV